MRRPDRIVATLVATGLAAALVWGLARCDGGSTPPLTTSGAVAPDAEASSRTGNATRVASKPSDHPGNVPDPAGRVDRDAALEFAAARTGYVGRVLAPGGVPAPDMEVRLLRGSVDMALPLGFDPFSTDPGAPQLVLASTTSDRDGRFELDGVLPGGICCLRFDFADVTRVSPAWRMGDATIVPVQRTAAPGEVVDLGDLHLKAGAVVSGRVVDDGAPIAGALVRAARLPPLPFPTVPIERLLPDGALIVTAAGRSGVLELPTWVARLLPVLPIAMTTTRADGTFELCGVDPGVVVVAVTAARRVGLLRRGVQVEPASTTSLGELQLSAGSRATVAVITADGEPVPGAEVVVAPLSTGAPIHIAERAGRTDIDGRVTVDGLPEGRALAAARRGPDDVWRIGEPGPADGELSVELPARYELTLTVLDADGDLAPAVRIKLVDGAAGLPGISMSMFGALQGVDRDAERLPDGRLRIEDLAAGPWWVVVGAAGCSTEAVEVDLSADLERTVRLRAARALRVRTIDAAGTAVADATIYTRSRGGERARRVSDLPLAAGRTDDDGWCTVRDLPTDETRVTAMHPLHGQVHAAVAGAPAELVLQFAAGGSIAGRLTDGGRPPAPGRWVIVLERRYDQVPRGALPDVPQLMLPDLDGDFAFAALQPGRYRLTVQDAVADVGSIGGFVEYQARRKQIYPWNNATVDLHGGEHIDIRLDAMVDTPAYTGPGAPVYGTVTVDGAPAAGALVVGTSTQPERRVTSRVDGAGVFDLGHCPTGSLKIVVVPREVAESRLLELLFSHEFARDVQVVDGQPLELRIDVATGSVVGQVTDWNGAPVADCRVVLFDRGGDGRSSALRVERTDAAGGFRFPRLPAGIFEVRAQKDGFGTAVVEDVQVRAGAVAAPLTPVLRPTARVAGHVDVDALPRKGPLGIALHPAAGGPPVRGGAKADGRFDLRDVPAGRYRVEVRVWGDPTVFDAGELEVRGPETSGVTLVPRAR